MDKPVRAAPHIRTVGDGTAWSLHWNDMCFNIRVDRGALVCDHFGPSETVMPAPLWAGWREHDIPQNARLPAMVAVGRRPLRVVWQVLGWESPADGCLTLTLAAEDMPLGCEVRFTIHPPTGILRRDTILRHQGTPGSAPIAITSALSFWLAVRSEIQEAEFLSGSWGGEAQPRVHPGGHAALELDSRTGKTGFEFQPWLVLRSRDTTYLCELLWSGNWELHARLHPAVTTLFGGLNDWGLEHQLAAGETLQLPGVILACDQESLDAATRRLHDWRRANRRAPWRTVPVQYNTWYPCDETPDEARLLQLIPIAARLGCETFVVDAGWYASIDGDPDNDWYLRAGDWIVDRTRFPNGLDSIRDAAAAAGMGFGIWCEPEAVGPRARVRTAHPDWLHHVDGKPPARDARALLNLGVPAAWDHARDVLFRLVGETGACWLKWDFNADLNGGGWAPGLPDELTSKDPVIAHYQGLYRLQEELLAAFPRLVLEMCASGAGRMDGAILSRAHTNWLSDHPQAVAKLAIHFGMQRAHPASTCNDWLVDWPPRAYSGIEGTDHRGDLAFRLRVAMLGSFGISAAIDRWSAADLDLTAAHIRLYRQHLRALIENGDQYQLTETPPIDGHGEWAAMWYVAKDGSKGVLFAFRLEGAPSQELALPGLRSGLRLVTGDGGELLKGGVRIRLHQPFRSALLLIEVGGPPAPV